MDRSRSPLRDPATAASLALSEPLNAPFAQLQQDNNTTLHSDYSNTSFNSDPTFTSDLDQAQFISDPSFTAFSQSAQTSATLGLDDLSAVDYGPNHLSPHSLSNHTSPAPDTNGFPGFDFSQDSLDSTLLGANELDLIQQQNYTSTMSTMNQQHPTPPHLLQQLGRNSSSPSPRATPSNQHSPFMNRPRNTSETLDPASAAFPQHGQEWSHMQNFRGHRRIASDQLSDISSRSAHASPYLGTMDNSASPMLNPAQDSTFDNGLGMGPLSISDPVLRHSYHSPAHSPHISPRLMPQQQPLPPYTAADQYGLGVSQYGQAASHDPFDVQEPFPSLAQGGSPGDFGLADQMSPPEIMVDFAPPSRPMDNSRPSLTDDTLGIPTNNRRRAKSDSHARPTTPFVQGRGRSPSLQPSDTLDALSPLTLGSQPSSREPSPARGRNGSLGRGRSASAASDSREYILDLADPGRSPSVGGDNKRLQKHPATFQCTLCPKRFTRAYNLRSHLRTHTDERPFVCTVCDKAFARQHDRKRHEGLHSGEKKFVCRGPLKSGAQWGCGRRFARADALGRHFRSEAGRVCIKPLLDEEAAEQQQAMWQEHQAQLGTNYIPQQIQLFPQALLQQYPALAEFNFNQQPQASIEEDYAGRSSFDASSGGEMYDELSENEMGIGSMNPNIGSTYPMPGQQQMINSYGNHTMGDFGNGFEGR